jgi:hypothetical protein
MALTNDLLVLETRNETEMTSKIVKKLMTPMAGHFVRVSKGDTEILFFDAVSLQYIPKIIVAPSSQGMLDVNQRCVSPFAKTLFQNGSMA